MAIRMVRKPSETPNINNIDDIIPFRYAYGNQNGYVIGKGQELSYTINDGEFKINSGRVVLQGVECDIDANGAVIAVDTSISTKMYYTVYYKVNMATNECSIDAIGDMANYPPIDGGDDLTENSTGVARLELYRFVVENNVINNVVKLVTPINYTTDVEVKNAINARNAVVKADGTFGQITEDEFGVLRCGDITIPYKKLITNSIFTITKNEYYVLDVGEDLSNNSIEIIYTLRLDLDGSLTEASGQYGIAKIRFQAPLKDDNEVNAPVCKLCYGQFEDTLKANVLKSDTNKIQFKLDGEALARCTVYSVSKIVE